MLTGQMGKARPVSKIWIWKVIGMSLPLKRSLRMQYRCRSVCWETTQKAIQVRDNGSLSQGKDEERNKQICKIFRRLKLGTLGKEMDGLG